ncbi:MAG TPA: ATP-dependent Clp protease ATP-binding subunit [Patescibacteria group bacterium]|nr:ATP-dependent Clp protease ATP-binding subunit [Patescibacteria group bacterium]
MEPNKLLERFSTHLRNVVAHSISLAATMGQELVTPAHLLWTLGREPGSIGAEILKNLNVDLEPVKKILDKQGTRPQKTVGPLIATVPELDAKSKKSIELAILYAFQRAHAHVGTEHLLLSLLEVNDKDLNAFFSTKPEQSREIKKQIEISFKNTSHFPELEEAAGIMEHLEAMLDSAPLVTPPRPSNRTASALEIFTIDLTDPDKQKNLDPVIGREKEIERIINILARRTKNNPVLVGEPGVGKTAIVEGLAKKILNKEVPDILKNKRVLALDMTLLVAGTIYRGEFEARLKQVIDEISRLPDVILFIDELHNIIGAGSSQGAMDAANILKPALARGLLHCLGATTYEEYKKYIAADPALERRFLLVHVEEPSHQETINILTGLRPFYEDYHGVKISPEATTAAVNLSERYIHDNFLPDKALDLIDEACAAAKTKKKLTSAEKQRNTLKEKILSLNRAKENALSQGDLEQALVQRQQIATAEKELTNFLRTRKKTPGPIITAADIAAIIAQRFNLEPQTVTLDELENLEKLEKRLNDQILGQEKAIGEIIQTLKKSVLGLKDRSKPTGAMLFVGPSGVGKTELAKILARELYQDEKALIRLDMSEFSEAHSTSKLLGSPAGYIGHKERNHFVEEIKKRPYCVILFDEIDKAHPDVLKLLLQILDDGVLTDSTGKKIHFHHALIILTTNLGAELFKSAGIGFGHQEHNTRTAIVSRLKENLSPALLSRLSNLIIFSPLSPETITAIVKKELMTLNEKIKANLQLSFRATTAAVDQLAKEAFHPDWGARQVSTTIENILEDLLTAVLKKKNPKKELIFTRTGDKFSLR